MESERFQTARMNAIEELHEVYQNAVEEVGETHAAIFDVHQMLLEDEDYIESIINIIQVQSINAEYAVATTGDNFAQMFSAMDDEYMKERAADIHDISERLIRVLTNKETERNQLENPCIVLADDLAPSETIQLDKNKVLAFVTRKGSINSHTAILARTMNIPAIVNVGSAMEDNGGNSQGKIVIVDGYQGLLILEPSVEVIEEYKRKLRDVEIKKELLQKYKGKKPTTKEGKEIKLYANIGGVGDVAAVLENDAAGIGLFRSEFLYLEKSTYPTEEEQFQVYKTIAEMMAGKPVIIRTLDIGADKQIDYFQLPKEENPALGFRAIRICLSKEEIFRTQLRAIFRASAYGNISILFPMIISEWEIIRVKEIIEEVKESIQKDDLIVGDVEIGIMIETPAAAMIANELAQHVDFFSIGSNDLTQYTLALDRQNSALDKFYDPHHPSVMRMIKLVIESAHENGIWVGICGELGGDLEIIEQFIEWGIDELSVSPSMVLPVKEKIIKYK